jgi:DinB superfamily
MTSQLPPAEIYARLEKIINGYIEALDGYTDEQFFYKPAEEVWSLGQMYEHLLITANYFFLANILRCLEQRKGQVGGEKNHYGDNLFKYNGFPPVKLKIPEVLRGPEPVAQSPDVYRAAFPKVLEDARKLMEPVVQNNGEYRCIQPAFGWLNAHEWYHLLEMHFRHHLRQQAELEAILKS